MFIATRQKNLLNTSGLISMLVGYRTIARKSRREHLFGISPCYAAITAANRRIFKLYLNNKLAEEEPCREHLCNIIEEAKSRDITTVYKSRTILDRLSGNRPHQNVVMEVGKLNCKVLENDINPSNNEQFWLALDQVQDPMNFGAILRSAAFFGVNRIVITNSNCCGLTSTVSKASSGAMEWAPIYGVNSMEKFLKRSLKFGWDVIGSFGVDNESYTDSSIEACEDTLVDRPSILVIGNEGFGLSEDIIKVCSRMITVPPFNPSLPHGLDSLNVSVAAGVMLHSLLRNRTTSTEKNSIQI